MEKSSEGSVGKHESLRYEPWNRRSRNYVRAFTLRLRDTRLCARSAASDVTVKKSQLVLAPCLRGKDFLWYETDKQELVLSKLLCLDATAKAKANNAPRLMKCHELRDGQEWKLRVGDDSTLVAIYNMAAGMCLGAEGSHAGAKVILELCSSDRSHMWQMNEMNDEL